MAQFAGRGRRSLERCQGWWASWCRLWAVVTGELGGGDDCVYIPERIINRPDPCLYDQFLLMQLGLPVTWDNPDVAILQNGIEQNTYDLVADTEYDVVITVHNSSREKPAVGTQVEVQWIEFGAGGQIRHPVASAIADAPVWPGTASVAVAWRTPASPGHYCIEVDLAHPDDGNPSNNRGWNNTQVRAAASEIQTPIRIFNRWPDDCPRVDEGGQGVLWPRVFGYALFALFLGPWIGRLGLSDVGAIQDVALLGGGFLGGAGVGYTAERIRMAIGTARARPAQHERISCHLVELTVDSYRHRDGKGKEVSPRLMFAPRPPAWPARLEPATFAFAPGEAHRDVLLIVDAPDGPGPAEVFNVSARQGGVAAGGVTVNVARKPE